MLRWVVNCTVSGARMKFFIITTLLVLGYCCLTGARQLSSDSTLPDDSIGLPVLQRECGLIHRKTTSSDYFYHQRMKCKPNEQFISSVCDGSCRSTSVYNPFYSPVYSSKCTCCEPACFSQTSINVMCEDGRAHVVPYHVVSQCNCRGCGSKPIVPSYPNILTATCDDSMRVWIDGVEQTQNTAGVHSWQQVTRYEYSDCAKVIAIQCTDTANAAMGLLAATSTGVVTDGSWKCYGNYGSNPPVASGWEKIGFNEAGWSAATVHGPNPTFPWSSVAGIPASANWIGYGSRYNVAGAGPDIYCRKTLP